MVVLYAGAPVADWTLAHDPRRYPDPSRLRSCTMAYALAGTAVSASFWSVRLWSPLDCTGLTLKTCAVPVVDPLPGLSAAAGCADAMVTRAARALADAAASTVARRDGRVEGIQGSPVDGRAMVGPETSTVTAAHGPAPLVTYP